MKPSHLALCAALIALAPLPAAARTGYGLGRPTCEELGGSPYWSGDRWRCRHENDRAVGSSAGLGPWPTPMHRRHRRGAHHRRLRRSAAAKQAFRALTPCPSTGAPQGPCPGYVIDHIIPLKRGGADVPSNMQWQTVEDAKAKDRVE